MQGVGLLDFTLGSSTIGCLTFLFLTLPCPVLTYSSQNRNMSDKSVFGAVGELPIASLATGLQQACAAISPNTTTAFMGCFKLAVSNAAALQSLSAATPSPQPTAAVPTTATTEPTPETPSDKYTGFATLDSQAFSTKKFASTAARSIDGRFVSKPGHNRRHECAQQGCGTQRWVYHDDDAGCWRVKEVGICEHNTRSAYMQGTALHLPLAMTLKLQDLLAGNCPQRAQALMREAFPGDALVNKMTARWITNWSQHRMTPPPSTKAALEKWINDLAPETNDGHDPYCFMNTIKEDGSCFVAGFTTPNLIRNARRGRGEDYLSIEGQFSITVEGFTMETVGTCDQAHHLLPLAPVFCVQVGKFVGCTNSPLSQ